MWAQPDGGTRSEPPKSIPPPVDSGEGMLVRGCLDLVLFRCRGET